MFISAQVWKHTSWISSNDKLVLQFSKVNNSFLQSDELNCQKKLRTEVIQLEDQLAQVRREYEMLRIEFEQTLAANEQTSKYISWDSFSISNSYL